jgi:hypothetical protein
MMYLVAYYLVICYDLSASEAMNVIKELLACERGGFKIDTAECYYSAVARLYPK